MEGILITLIVILLFLFLILIRLYRQHIWGYCETDDDLKGKTFVVTGANCGIGFETAKGLVKRGARVVFACRNIDSANEAIANIRKTKRKEGGEMIAMQVDLGSLESIRSFVEVMKVAFNKIDVLINNAGVAVPTHLGQKTVDGFEINMGVNHLGPFLLTNLLIDRLQAAAPSRVVIVSSRNYKAGKIDFQDLNLDKKLEEIQKSAGSREDPAYDNSKLMNLYFGKGLAERSKDKGIDVFILCPGFTYSKLFRNSLKWFHYVLLAPIFFFIMKSTKQGAQTSLYCATEPSLKGQTGTFYTNCKLTELEIQYDKVVEDKLWSVSENLVEAHMA